MHYPIFISIVILGLLAIAVVVAFRNVYQRGLRNGHAAGFCIATDHFLRWLVLNGIENREPFEHDLVTGTVGRGVKVWYANNYDYYSCSPADIDFGKECIRERTEDYKIMRKLDEE